MRDGVVATVTLSNPERPNALSLEMWERLGKTFTSYPLPLQAIIFRILAV